MNIKSILPLLILLVLGVATYYLLLTDQKKQSNPNEDWVMKVENKADIHRIFIADRKGGKADLVRDGDKWIYNGKYNANPSVMDNVLDAVTRIEMKNRPASAAIPHMIKTLSAHSTKVEVYGKNNKLLKAYYVGGVTPDERGTFMIMEGSENPYVMYLPLAEVSLKQRYFTEEIKWRDKTVFEFQADDVASLSLEYPKQKNKSYTIKRQGSKWNVEPFFPTTKKIDKPVNQDLVESYLDGYKKIIAEAIEKASSKTVQTATSSKEFCIIKVLFRDNTRKEVRFFPIIKIAEDSETPNPIDRYIAVDEKNTIYMTQQLVFKDAFWAYDFFF
jgi:hypothetical protein